MRGRRFATRTERVRLDSRERLSGDQKRFRANEQSRGSNVGSALPSPSAPPPWPSQPGKIFLRPESERYATTPANTPEILTIDPCARRPTFFATNALGAPPTPRQLFFTFLHFFCHPDEKSPTSPLGVPTLGGRRFGVCVLVVVFGEGVVASAVPLNRPITNGLVAADAFSGNANDVIGNGIDGVVNPEVEQKDRRNRDV